MGGAGLFEELFGAAAGGGGRSRSSQNIRGEDIDTTVGISFLDAAKGTTRAVNVTSIVECSSCSGSGLKAGAKRSTCSDCGGTGTRRYAVDTGFHMATMCYTCNGQGSTVAKGSQCTSCAGVGRLRARKTVSVSIPAGQ